VPPEHRGLGSLIITRLLERSLVAKVTLRFDPEGLSWSLTAPAPAVLEASAAEL
jgi:two-component sensor histidine kinase